MKQAIVIENFISAETCQQLIQMGAQHQRVHSGIQDTVVRKWKHISDIVSPEGSQLQDALQLIHKAVGDKVTELYECGAAEPRDVGYFYEYQTGDFYLPHVDSQTVRTFEGVTTANRKVSSSDISSVLYLNDNFIGGEIDFPLVGKMMRPKAGRLLLFYGGWENAHAVRPIEFGKRYCIVNWYKTETRLVPSAEIVDEKYADFFTGLEHAYAKARNDLTKR